MLVLSCVTLNYYREDIMSKNAVSEIFKIGFFDFVQELLREVGHFYDCYLGEMN
jgi:hypothetical protein